MNIFNKDDFESELYLEEQHDKNSHGESLDGTEYIPKIESIDVEKKEEFEFCNFIGDNNSFDETHYYAECYYEKEKRKHYFGKEMIENTDFKYCPYCGKKITFKEL